MAVVVALAMGGTAFVLLQQAQRSAVRETVLNDLDATAARARVRLALDLQSRLHEIRTLAERMPRRGDTIDPEASRRLLEDVQALNADWAWIGVAGVDGGVQAATGRLLEGESVKSRRWFQLALDGGGLLDVHEAALLAKYLRNNTGVPPRFVDVVAPVRNAAGAPVCVLGGHLDVRWASRVLSMFDRDRRGRQVLVLDREQRVLFGPPDMQTTLFKQPAFSQVASVAAERIARWPDGRDYLIGRSDPVAAQDAADGGLGWRVLVALPLQQLDEASRRYDRWLAAVVTAATLLGLLGWLHGRRQPVPPARFIEPPGNR